MSTGNDKLDELLKKAKEAFEALTPEEKEAHRREQAIDWAYGEMLWKYGENPPFTREQIGAIYDDRKRAGKDLSEE